LFDFNPLRQAMGTAIARNYVQNPSAEFLLPQVDNDGASPGYFMFELPIIPYAVSFLIRAVGLHNWVFRLPIIILFGLSAFYFYKLCRLLTDNRVSIMALIFYCISPISVLMGRVFQSESLILLAMFISIYHILRWLETGKTLHLCVATCSLMGLVLLKITNLYIFLFILALFFIYKKTNFIPRAILPVFFVLAVNLWWWGIYSSGVRAAFPTNYTLVSGEAIFGPKFLLQEIWRISFSPEYWALIIRQTITIIFSPIIFMLAVFGVFAKKKSIVAWVLAAWIASAAVFIFAVPMAAVQDYYKIHFLPPGAILAAMGYWWILDKFNAGWRKRFFVFVLWAAISATIFLTVFPVIKFKPVFEKQEVLGKKVEAMTLKDDLVLTSFGPDAMLLYYCNRKGWSQYLPAKDENCELLEKRREEGARYFVCGNLDELDSDPEFREYLSVNYELVGTGERQYAVPRKWSLDYFIWYVLGEINLPAAEEARKKLEKESLGYVIYDLRGKS